MDLLSLAPIVVFRFPFRDAVGYGGFVLTALEWSFQRLLLLVNLSRDSSRLAHRSLLLISLLEFFPSKLTLTLDV